jgi:ketosteroid isomerase-like protein
LKRAALAVLFLLLHGTAHADDAQDVRAVVDAYPRYVTAGDRTDFEKLLLDTDVTFRGVYDDHASSSQALRDYAGFRSSVFESGRRFSQVFSNVHVDVHGDIAQVSLDFVTTDVAQPGKPTKGWKILQLVRTKDGWRIASELWGPAR